LPDGFDAGNNQPDPFLPVAALGEAVLERHRARRESELPGLVDYTLKPNRPATRSALKVLPICIMSAKKP